MMPGVGIVVGALIVLALAVRARYRQRMRQTMSDRWLGEFLYQDGKRGEDPWR